MHVCAGMCLKYECKQLRVPQEADKAMWQLSVIICGKGLDSGKPTHRAADEWACQKALVNPLSIELLEQEWDCRKAIPNELHV